MNTTSTVTTPLATNPNYTYDATTPNNNNNNTPLFTNIQLKPINLEEEKTLGSRKLSGGVGGNNDEAIATELSQVQLRHVENTTKETIESKALSPIYGQIKLRAVPCKLKNDANGYAGDPIITTASSSSSSSSALGTAIGGDGNHHPAVTRLPSDHSMNSYHTYNNTTHHNHNPSNNNSNHNIQQSVDLLPSTPINSMNNNNTHNTNNNTNNTSNNNIHTHHSSSSSSQDADAHSTIASVRDKIKKFNVPATTVPTPKPLFVQNSLNRRNSARNFTSSVNDEKK